MSETIRTTVNASPMRRYLSGRYPLRVVFWLGYVLPAIGFGILYALLFAVAFPAAPLSPAFLFSPPIIMTAGAIFLGFTYVAIWRSAMNVSFRPLGYLARAWVVLHGLHFSGAFIRSLLSVPELVAHVK